jgi:hypothetical protein
MGVTRAQLEVASRNFPGGSYSINQERMTVSLDGSVVEDLASA